MTTYKEVVCCQCREPFGLSTETWSTLQRNGHTFRCPWGHQQVFSSAPSEADLLRRERDRLKQQTARLEEERDAAYRAEQAALEHANFRARQASAARGQVTKLKNRAANGVCPCCNRTFVDLQRHMSSKHKGFLAEPVAGAEAMVS